MNIYEKPEIKIVKFEVEDVIASSGGSATVDGGIVNFPGGWINTTVDGGTADFNTEWENQ